MPNIVIYDNWIKPTEAMNEDQKREYFGILCLHRSGLPQRPEDTEDNVVRAALISVLPMVDLAEKSREENSERGKRGGRRKAVDDIEVHDFVLAHPTYTCQQVADYFGVSRNTIGNNRGWKERDKMWF